MKNVRCDSQFHRADPEYPFRSEWNENGGITYYAPIEVDSAEALITLNAEETGGIRYLRFNGCEPIPVIFRPVTNRELAFMLMHDLNTQRSKEGRRAAREWFFEGDHIECDGEEIIARDEHPLLATVEQGYTDIENTDVIGRIADEIEKRHPGNKYYRSIFLMTVEQTDPKTIAQRLDISIDSVYFYQKECRRMAKEYRRKYIGE